ncbi:MAG TPA: hypothetical protein VF599_15855 [Pyrinomonadaceae bacterium]|jgi:hypothetical protein
MKITAAILILFFSYNLALACSCQSPNDAAKDAAVRSSPVIFQGKVVSINRGWFSQSTDVEVKFQVLRAWKGVETNEVIVKTSAHSSACGYSFKEDSTYTVYAYGNPSMTNTCTMLTVDENRVRQSLGEGRVFENSPSQQENFFGWFWQKFTSIFS